MSKWNIFWIIYSSVIGIGIVLFVHAIITRKRHWKDYLKRNRS